MNNNDRLVRLRYALDIKDNDMVEIFKLGDKVVTVKDVQQLLTKIKQNQEESEEEHTANEYVKACDNQTLESFLNGLIVFKRGKKEESSGETKKHQSMIKNDRSVNNVLLKKVKIALTLTSDDMLDILDEAGVYISNSELSAVLRKEGQRNYKECGDRYARNFLKGLALRYRG
ncbi:DUF1456 family protein [Marinilactibacillus sp. Marseille-P9653]|uniref:DUF1456 family protein n=1 Tax=Marinilactibacillus sp. Marseille-P9653 TaxID=2866583 RepID=UPI001CE40A52|nr:DUF1456 family protein [Marinilactibacillus sp. Marseille-P9653]